MTANDKVKTYRTVFLSDLHMGWSRSNCGDAALLLDTLKCDTLYLNGDIFDGWKLRRRWFWAEDHELFLSAVLRKIDDGTKVVLQPGNHDETLRDPTLLPVIKKISLRHEFNFQAEGLHRTAKGRYYRVMHGDQFDDSFTRAISETADRAYNGSLERIKGKGRPKKVANKEKAFSLGKYFRKIAKGGGTSLSSSNKKFIDHIRRKLGQDDKTDGIIIGHTHMPSIEQLKANTEDNKTKNKGKAKHAFLYANSGDWVHSMTALVETHEGQLKLLHAKDVLSHHYFENRKILKAQNKIIMHPKAPVLRRWLHKLWAPEPLSQGSYSGTSKKQRQKRRDKIFNS